MGEGGTEIMTNHGRGKTMFNQEVSDPLSDEEKRTYTGGTEEHEAP